jgi:hypothetical protein
MNAITDKINNKLLCKDNVNTNSFYLFSQGYYYYSVGYFICKKLNIPITENEFWAQSILFT